MKRLITEAFEPVNVQTFPHNGSIVSLHIGRGDVNAYDAVTLQVLCAELHNESLQNKLFTLAKTANDGFVCNKHKKTRESFTLRDPVMSTFISIHASKNVSLNVSLPLSPDPCFHNMMLHHYMYGNILLMSVF